jgi:hypothetical protein
MPAMKIQWCECGMFYNWFYLKKCPFCEREKPEDNRRGWQKFKDGFRGIIEVNENGLATAHRIPTLLGWSGDDEY